MDKSSKSVFNQQKLCLVDYYLTPALLASYSLYNLRKIVSAVFTISIKTVNFLNDSR